MLSNELKSNCLELFFKFYYYEIKLRWFILSQKIFIPIVYTIFDGKDIHLIKFYNLPIKDLIAFGRDGYSSFRIKNCSIEEDLFN